MEPLGSKPLPRSAAACVPETRQRKRLQSCSDTESCASARPVARRKRARRCGAAPRAAPVAAGPGADGPPAAAPAESGPLCPHDLSLFVRWHSTEGGVRVNRLRLEPIAGVEGLQGLARRLVKGAFEGAPGGLPDYLTSPAYYKFTPAEELISLTGDVAATEFRLAVTLEGWEYTLCERTLPGTPDPERRLLVTLAEFESDAVTVADRQYVARLLAYPTVCVNRAFLDDALAALLQGRTPGQRCSPQACSAPPSPSLSSA